MKKNIFIIMGLFLSLSSSINAATIRLSPVNVEILSNQNAASISFRQNQDSGNNEAVRLSIFGIVPSVTYNFKF
jgi:fimbrial chaperone protein